MITLVTEADASDADDTHDDDDDGVVTGLIKLNTTTGRHGDCGVVSVGKEAHNTLHDHSLHDDINIVCTGHKPRQQFQEKMPEYFDKHPDLQTQTFKCSVVKCGITVVDMTVHA